MPCITTTCDTGALTVLSKSFFYAWQTGNRMTMCCFFMSDCSTKVSFLFRHEKKEIRRQTQKTQTAPANDLRSETKPAEPKAAARGTSSGLFVLYLTTWVVCTEAACDRDRVRSSPINFFSFLFLFLQKELQACSRAPKKKKQKEKRRFLYRSEERKA